MNGDIEDDKIVSDRMCSEQLLWDQNLSSEASLQPSIGRTAMWCMVTQVDDFTQLQVTYVSCLSLNQDEH